ncbi:MAG: (2Fe-2S)-binding protein [Scytonema hyalinum WJT4-NPBG1]|nr:(2Fe-2S)-binding protein [Scytonema hyalinum WJT4-NPBG1]
MRIRLRRRRFCQLAIVSTVATALGNCAFSQMTSTQSTKATAQTSRGDINDVSFRINGKQYNLKLEPRVTLLDALRENIGLTGTKKGCNHGACGACTVIVDGRRVNSCLTLAVMNVGKEITTVEGLAKGDQLHPVQTAFIKHDGFQCGYCTPGQIMSAVALLKEGHTGSDTEIQEWMSGNICRCGAYPNIVAAIKDVAQGGGNASV